MRRPTRIVELLDRPEVVNTSGALALFLQFAHPLVAAGVASTGKFQGCPRSRLQHTSKAIHTLMACGMDKASQERLAGHLAQRHAQIQGELSAAVGGWQAGTRYSASDPQLLLWVYATLVVSRVKVFSMFHRPLSSDEQELFYQSTRAFGEFFGITADVRPLTYDDLLCYFELTLESLVVGEDGRGLIDAFLASLGSGARGVRAIVSELLPRELCTQYGILQTKRLEREAMLYCFLIARFYAPLQPVLKRVWYSLDLHMRTKQTL